ncbi:hypothetical protein V8E55_002267 [Tylopilus felleus]
MSTEPAEPNTTPAPTSATAWIQSHLTALYEDIHTQDAFDRAFSPACDVRVNHETRGVQALREDLAARRTATTHVHIAWDPSVVSTNEDKPDEPAIVAGALVVTRSLPFRIRVGLAQRETHVRFSARIERDASVQDGDQRRITSFYYTAVEKTPPLHFLVPRATQVGGSDGR